ncbi:GGDEF domain-containing protein [Sinanaerobacter sp. ZZT-01]|uniref:GGDEF domain-containing protein n=1 Tax=Sinanaerobacter sp. ZZT-01 TaxID=3111540 RepID=UPI002D77A874|nr:GGDEF domain-containing protein [Sinanaerobacter sp. ZZT-01]WRR92303.1 GGDEF domain-containing protein [Sinanaerobacter sp. ZZT-01]
MKSHRGELIQMKTISKLFDCIRLIDIESETLYAEYPAHQQHHSIPAFDYSVRQELYHRCLAADTTMYWVEQESQILMLFSVSPVEIDERRLIMECAANVTGKINMSYMMGKSNILLENAYQLSITDELTGLYNRRYINQMLPNVIKDCAKQNLPLSLLFTDLDYFKKTNDSYGHVAGDYLLYEFSTELKKEIRKSSDWAARYGGDEFLLCLVGTENQTAKKRAEEIRSIIESKVFRYHSHEIKTTCSFGVFTINKFDPMPTCDSIFREIDKKLYEAKREGRNTIR